MSHLFNKENYELAKKNGELERFRSDEISNRIGQEVILSEQIAILADRDEKPEKYKRYQALRKQKIAEVDKDLKAFEEMSQ